MKIGERIKQLRTSKMMTQAQLCGNEITRNMLSEIENGKATPSVGTIVYLAKKLSVQPGYLLAEDGDLFTYKKSALMNNVYAALRLKQFDVCKSICINEIHGTDDEINYVLAQCEIGLAFESIKEGRIHAAISQFEAAVPYLEKTVLDTGYFRSVLVYGLRYVGLLSPTLYSDVIDAENEMQLPVNEFCAYTACLCAIERGDYALVSDVLLPYLSDGSFYASLVNAKIWMNEGKYAQAKPLLQSILDHIDQTDRAMFYFAICDAEICSRETDDYKQAYVLSQEKVTILEKMLEEDY